MDRNQRIYEIAEEIRAETGKQDWNRVRQLLRSRYKIETSSKNAVRKAYDYYVQKHGKPEIKPVEKSTDTRALLIGELQKERTINQLCSVTGLTNIELLGNIEQLRLDGYEIIQFRVDNEVGYSINKNVSTTYHEFKHHHEPNQTFRIGVVSDTHICSRFWQKTYLKLAYARMKDMGITDVYHAGDITDGTYKDRMEETYAFGADAQVDEVVEQYPYEPGMTTYLITGNHDYTHMRNGGVDIGRAIANRRPDIKYLGRDYAKVWLTDKVDMDLIHPGDGTSYALSYQLQKRINNMSGGTKPKILVSGHYHKFFTMFYRNVWAISAASFQSQSNWMRGKALESDMGYLVLEISVNEDGDLVECAQHYYPFYIPLKEDYH